MLTRLLRRWPVSPPLTCWTPPSLAPTPPGRAPASPPIARALARRSPRNKRARPSSTWPPARAATSRIVFATIHGTAKVTDPADKSAIETALATLKSIPQVSAITTPFQSHLVSPSGQIALGQVQWSVQPTAVTDSSLDAVRAAMRPVQADGVQVAYNGSVYPGWRTVISEAPELTGLIHATDLDGGFTAWAAVGLPVIAPPQPAKTDRVSRPL